MHRFHHTLAAAVFFFLFAPAALATDLLPQTSRYVSVKEFESGLTVTNGDEQMRIAVPARAFSENAYIFIENRNESDLGLPEGKLKVGNAYRYDVKVSAPRILDRPLRVGIRYYGTGYNSPSLHYFDATRSAWLPVVSAYDRATRTVSAYLPFPAATVTLLEDEVRRADTVQVSVPVAAAAVIDAVTGALLFDDHASAGYPLASITKVMTGLVFLDHNPGWDTAVVMAAADDVGGSRAPLKTGERVLVRDLFESMLIASGNNSARALARSTGLSGDAFIRLMNRRAAQLGLRDTVFTDVTGIQRGNRSSARDAAQLARVAFAKQEFIDATTKSDFSFYTVAAQQYTVQNTNAMLKTGDLEIQGSKTGHLDASGYNLALKVAGDERAIIIVVLGARSRTDSYTAARDLARAF